MYGLYEVKDVMKIMGIHYKCSYYERAGMIPESNTDNIPETGIRIFLDYSEKNHLMSDEVEFDMFRTIKGSTRLFYRSRFRIGVDGFLIPKSELDEFVQELEASGYEYHLVKRGEYDNLFHYGKRYNLNHD
jgi:hypothetical protein